MPRETHGHKKDKSGAVTPRSLRARKTIVYRVESKGPFGCLTGLAFICLMLGALAAFFFLGFVTLTVALWIGSGFILLTLIMAALRRIFGSHHKD